MCKNVWVDKKMRRTRTENKGGRRRMRKKNSKMVEDKMRWMRGFEERAHKARTCK